MAGFSTGDWPRSVPQEPIERTAPDLPRSFGPGNLLQWQQGRISFDAVRERSTKVRCLVPDQRSLCRWLLMALLWGGCVRGETPLGVRNLRCEYKVDPLGIDVKKPRLSWELVSAERGVLQTSYEIRVGASEMDLAKGKLLWDSGEQSSDASIQVEYAGPALES